MSHPLVLYGGTFDPIHWGHIRTADALRAELDVTQVRFLVSARPPHRSEPVASAQQRLRMVELALREHPGLVADGRELARPGPSYTLWTLRECRAEQPERPLVWVIGADSLSSLNTWFQWQQLLALAHWVVLPRPGSGGIQLPAAMEDWVVTDPIRLHGRTAGKVYIANTPELMISATEVRTALAQGRNTLAELPDPVAAYIQQQHLYQMPQAPRGVHAV